jgi:hypothetical protein
MVLVLPRWRFSPLTSSQTTGGATMRKGMAYVELALRKKGRCASQQKLRDDVADKQTITPSSGHVR